MTHIAVFILALIAVIASLTSIYLESRAPQEPPGVELVMGHHGLECVRYGHSNLSCADMATATDKTGH